MLRLSAAVAVPIIGSTVNRTGRDRRAMIPRALRETQSKKDHHDMVGNVPSHRAIIPRMILAAVSRGGVGRRTGIGL